MLGFCSVYGSCFVVNVIRYLTVKNPLLSYIRQLGSWQSPPSSNNIRRWDGSWLYNNQWTWPLLQNPLVAEAWHLIADGFMVHSQILDGNLFSSCSQQLFWLAGGGICYPVVFYIWSWLEYLNTTMAYNIQLDIYEVIGHENIMFLVKN